MGLLSNVMAVALISTVSVLAAGAMPVSTQNDLIGKYCAVCHNDAHVNGGLSLEHFDAAHSDPGIAAMLASKLRGKAMGASGMPLPDQATQDALLDALTQRSVGAQTWVVNREPLMASIVEEFPVPAKEGGPFLYRLTLTCLPASHEGEMRLSWSPGVPAKDAAMSASIDGGAPSTHHVDGSEKAFRGATNDSGTGAINLKIPLPAKTLTISDLFPNQTVVFPFDALSSFARKSLSACFAGTE